jgi:hypothetical protein
MRRRDDLFSPAIVGGPNHCGRARQIEASARRVTWEERAPLSALWFLTTSE